jgi:hypothetical protein
VHVRQLNRAAREIETTFSVPALTTTPTVLATIAPLGFEHRHLET